jgi:hypothetical protein
MQKGTNGPSFPGWPSSSQSKCLSAGSFSFCHQMVFSCFAISVNSRGIQDSYSYIQTAGHIQDKIELLKFHYPQSFNIVSVVNQAYFKLNTSYSTYHIFSGMGMLFTLNQ